MQNRNKKNTREFQKKCRPKTKLETIQYQLSQDKKEEKLLPIEENIWETIFHSVSDWIFLTDLDGKIIKTNEAGEKYTGLSCTEITGQSCCKLLHNSTIHVPDCPIQEMKRTGQKASSEILLPDGKWIQVTVDPVRNNDNKIESSIHIVRYITERKQTEEILRSNEAQLSNAAKIAKIGYWEYEATNRLFILNDQFYSIFRTTAEQIGGYTMTPESYAEKFLHPDDRSVVANEMKKVREISDTNFNRQLEHRILYADGKIGTISLRYFVSKNSQGRPTKICGAIQDITEYKKAVESLKDSEEQYRQIISSTTDAVGLFDAKTRIFIDVNKAAEDLYGYSREEFLSLTYEAISAETDGSEHLYKELLKERFISVPLRYHKKKNGQIFPVEVSGSAFKLNGRDVMCGIVRDITEHQKDKQEISNLKDFYGLILDNVQDGIWVSDEKDRLIYFNSGMEKIAGIKSDDVLGLSVIKDFPPETNSQFLPFYRKAKKTLEPQEYEAIVVTPAGRETVQSGWLIPRVKDGKYEGMICTIQDITERKQAQAKLQEMEISLRTLIDSVPDSLFMIKTDGTLTVVNKGLAKNFGKTKEELIGSNTFDLVNKEIGNKRWEYMNIVLDTGMPVTFEDQRHGRYMEHRLFPVKDKNGKVTHISIHGRDITEQKIAQKERLESEEKFRSVVENIRDGIIVVQDGKRVYCNPRWLEIVGYSTEEYQNIPFLSLIHPEDIELVTNLYKKMKNSEIFDSKFEFRLITKSKQIKFITAKASVIQWENKTAELVVLEDITKRKIAEKALLKSEEKYRNLFNNAQVGMFRSRLDGSEFLESNEKFLSILGMTREDITGKPIATIWADLKEREKLVNILKAEGQVSNFECKLINKAGEVKNCIASLKLDPESGIVDGSITDETERKKAEIKLKESEVRYRELFENMPSGVAVYEVIDGGKDFIFKDFNHAGEQFDNQLREQLIGKSIFEVRTGAENFGLIEAFRKALKSGKHVHHPITLYKDDRLSAWYDNNIYLLPSGELVAIFRDVTKTKKAEEALKENEEKLNIILDTVPAMIWAKDLNGKFLWSNKYYVDSVGISKDELAGKTDYEIFKKEQAENFMKDDIEVAKTLKPKFAIIEQYHRANGTDGWAKTNKLPFFNKSNELIGTIGLAADITEQKLAQDALQENERLLNEVGRIAKIGGWEMDLITRKAKWTQGTYDIVEIEYDQPIPGPDEHLDYYLPEYRPKVEQAMNELIEKDIPLEFEAKGKTAKGNIKWFRVIGRAIRQDGVCIKLIGTLQDITENKQAEEIINNHRRMLEKQMFLTRTLLDALPCVALLLKPETHEIVASNKAALKVGAVPGKTCYETWAQRSETCPWCMAPELWKTGEEQHIEIEYMGIAWDAYWIRVSDDLYMHFAFDITERKKIEASIFKYQQELKSLSSQLTLTEEKERYRLATHLHDQIGQYLAVSRIKLVELLNSEISEETYNTVKLIDEWLHHAIQETRSLTYDLSSPILHELGIKKAIASWLNDEIRIKHQIETEYYCDSQQISLDDDIQILLFRNVRELLFNVVKHAHASKIKVTIETKDNNIQIIVEDNGVGFNPAEIAETSPGKAQFGLFSIRERLEQFGGNMKIETATGQGCKITLAAPMKND